MSHRRHKTLDRLKIRIILKCQRCQRTPVVVLGPVVTRQMEQRGLEGRRSPPTNPRVKPHLLLFAGRAASAWPIDHESRRQDKGELKWTDFKPHLWSVPQIVPPPPDTWWHNHFSFSLIDKSTSKPPKLTCRQTLWHVHKADVFWILRRCHVVVVVVVVFIDFRSFSANLIPENTIGFDIM